VAWWFAVLGSNALFIYLVGEILWTMVWMRWRFRGPDGNGHVMFTALQAHMASLTSAAIGPWLATLVYTMVYWMISWYFQRRGWIIKV
jgi:predicted acyltransferase